MDIYGRKMSFDKERPLWIDIYGKVISFDKERYWLKSSLKLALYLLIRSFNHFLSTTSFSFLYEWILSRNSSTSFFEGDGLDGSGVLMPGVVITGFWASLVLLMFVSVIFFFRICFRIVKCWISTLPKSKKYQKKQTGNKNFKNPKMKTSA